MPASFNVRDWIGWGADNNDPNWRSRATSWFNDLTQYARETRVDLDAEVAELDSHITDFNNHLTDAGWAAGGQTFERQSTSSNTRITDVYTASSSVQTQINGVRVDLDSPALKVQYDAAGANEIYRVDRTGRRMEHHSGARLNGGANYYTNWQNYGGGWADGWWFRMPDGEVIWEGLVRRTGSTSPTSVAFILTNGAGRVTRPQQIHPVMTSLGAGRVDSFSNGQLVYQGTGIPVNGWISLSGIRYLDDWR